MPQYTSKFNLGYYLPGDITNDSNLDLVRFTTIDSQLTGIYTIIGNGVISGFSIDAAPNDKLSVTVGEGTAIVNLTSVNLRFPVNLQLTLNGSFYIYLVYNSESPVNATGAIVASQTLIDDPYHLFLGTVQTDASGVQTIDTTAREDISFLQQIRDEIKKHKHRGGNDHPSKIDLETDVQGKLSPDNIDDLPASKITRGTIDPNRLPLIDHSILDNIGKLTHSQLDAFVKSLEVNNKELFGEIIGSNQLQRTIREKLIFDDPSSPYYITDGPSDKYHNNEFVIIPGVTDDKLIDYDATTATVDITNRIIEGKAPTQGSTFYVTYDKAVAWNTAYKLTNVAIVGDSVTLTKDPNNETSIKVIEDFESSGGANQTLSDGSLFTKEIVTLVDKAEITSEFNATNVAQGAFSGKTTSYQSFRLKYVKKYSTAQDWSAYDSLLLDIKTNETVHTAVKMYLTSSDGQESTHYLLLDTNEVTEDPENNGFVTRIIDLSAISFSDKISSISIYLDDLSSQFVFYIDSITLQKATLLPTEGTMIVRYSSSSPVTFSALDWVDQQPTGSELKVRARSANGTVLLTRANFTNYLNSGDSINLRGTDIEIEVTFLSDTDRVVAPKLDKLRLIILSDTNAGGLTISSLSDLSRGTTINTQINELPESKGSVTLKEPIYVGSHYFVSGNSVQQVVQKTENGNTFTESQFAVFGTNTPLSPNLVIKNVEKNPNSTTKSSSFIDPKSVIRLQNRNLLIADTGADRILEMDESGNVVAGFGSINYTFSKLFPIAASVNIENGILYVVWSRSIQFKLINVNRITLQTTTTSVPLRKDFDLVLNLNTSDLESVSAEGQITPIYLSDQNRAILENLDQLYLNVASDVITGGIDSDSTYYRSIRTGIGIPCFIGNFTYISGINAPSYAGPTDSGYTIANSKIGVKTYTVPDSVDETLTLADVKSFSSILEIDSTGLSLWAAPDNWVEFCPFVPGRAEQIDSTTLLIGGVKPTTTTSTTTLPTIDFTTFSKDPTTLDTQKTNLKTLFAERSGIAAVISDYKSTNWSYNYYYVSPKGTVVSDADFNENLYVALTSFGNSGGKVLQVDIFGNVVFDFGSSVGLALVNDIAVKDDGKIVIST